MPTITSADDGFQIAMALSEAANQVNQSMLARWDTLTKAQRDTMDDWTRDVVTDLARNIDAQAVYPVTG